MSEDLRDPDASSSTPFHTRRSASSVLLRSSSAPWLSLLIYSPLAQIEFPDFNEIVAPVTLADEEIGPERLPLPPATVTGTLALVHGFTDESSWFLQLITIYFTKAGFVTCVIDHQGHGFSDGLIAHIPDINPVVDDCIAFFDEFRSRFDPSLPFFLYSESLGGAIALLITLRCCDSPENVSFANRARLWFEANSDGGEEKLARCSWTRRRSATLLAEKGVNSDEEGDTVVNMSAFSTFVGTNGSLLALNKVEVSWIACHHVLCRTLTS
ncbi:hypothetical protein Ahy_B10g106491 [Arachis hypogaea]|uniref:Serine aminopeptidase S33 domain-containing protein n=2 Tax=Arachis TaxID=3817 RepID=A0A444XB17_ARAHY|nr:hypothetical protein Ahy_B10g106491 [Arachis hypogaea]